VDPGALAAGAGVSALSFAEVKPAPPRIEGHNEMKRHARYDVPRFGLRRRARVSPICNESCSLDTSNFVMIAIQTQGSMRSYLAHMRGARLP